MGEFNVLKAIGVFFGVFIVDFIWTIYIRRTNAGDRHPASLSSAFLYFIGGVVVITYTKEPVYLIIASCGAYWGTWTGITYAKRKKPSR